MWMERFLSVGNFCLSYRKLRFHTIKMLREDAHSAQGYMVAEATAPRRENVPRYILFIHDNRILAGVHSIVAVEERKESKWIRSL